MTATFVDERRAPARGTIQLAAMRWAALGQLVGAIAHALLPLPPREGSPVLPQSVGDLGHAARAAEVGAESRESVVDDMCVRVVEPGQHSSAGKVDHLCLRAAQAHELGFADGDDTPAGDRQVAVRLET